MWESDVNELVEHLGDVERKMVVVIGRYSDVSGYQQYHIFSHNASPVIYLHRSSLSYARHRCSSHLPVLSEENQLGHDELCLSRNLWTTSPHDNVEVIFAKALSTLASTFVDVDPRTLEEQRRDDIRIRDRGMSGSRSLDYDLKMYSLYDAHAPSRPPELLWTPANRNTPWHNAFGA